MTLSTTCRFVQTAEIFFGTSADVFVDICHFTDVLFTSFPRSFFTTHFYCVLYLYNSPPSNHAYSTELTTNNMQANDGPSDRGTKNRVASNRKSDSSYPGDNSHSRNLQSRVVICGDDPSLLPSSRANASAISTSRVQRKKTLTKKGKRFTPLPPPSPPLLQGPPLLHPLLLTVLWLKKEVSVVLPANLKQP
jgi:hypothetical protein